MVFLLIPDHFLMVHVRFASQMKRSHSRFGLLLAKRFALINFLFVFLKMYSGNAIIIINSPIYILLNNF